MTYTIKTNEKQRTATIRVYEGRELIAKYQTYPFGVEDYKTVLHWTECDIKNFLRYESGKYYESK